MKPPPEFTTYDLWLGWILDKLRKRAWQSEDTATYVEQLFTAYKSKVTKPPFAEFLADRIEALPPELTLRLGAYVLADADIMAARNKRANKSLISRLARTKVPDQTSYRFERGRTFTGDELNELIDTALQQFLVAAGNHAGRRFRTLESYRKSLDADVVPAATYWQILDGRQPVYELWQVHDRSGSIFLSGATKAVAVLRQGELNSKAKPELAIALQRLSPFRRTLRRKR